MDIGFRIPTKVDTESPERAFDLRQYLNFVWRNWIFIVSATALAFLVAVIYLVQATPLYTATTQVLLAQRENAPGLGPINDARSVESIVHIENQLAILRSDSLLRRVVLKEGLAPSNTKADAAQNKNDSTSAERAIVDGVNRLRDALGVTRNGHADVLSISITWGDPVRAAELANAISDAYVVDQLNARLDSAKRTSGWLSDRLAELRRQLSNSEEAVAKFRSEHGLTQSGPTIALTEQQLTNLNNKLVTARTDVAEKKARVGFISDLAEGKKTLRMLPDSLMSTTMVTLRAKLTDASQREADLLARYNSRYPAVVNVEAEKRDIERSIAAEAQRIEQTAKSEYTLAKGRLNAIEQAMGAASGQGELSNDDAVKLRELERTAAVNKTLFEEFLQKAKITGEQATFRPSDLRVIMPAQPGGQSFPNSRKVLLMALLAGIGLGAGGAFAMELLRAGFTDPREVEAMLGVPVLASVRKVKKNQLVKNGKSFALPVYQLYFPLSPFSESIRTLRSSIHMSDVDLPPKVVQFTSARPGEGKTTLAMSFAISAVLAGKKVVLIDADLRHPSASRYFNLEKETGLVDLLMGATTVSDVLKLRQDLKIMVIPAGTKSLNPPDVLGSERMKGLISQLKETFDYVVLDTPPIGPVVDPIIVANLVDKTIFVVQWGSTPRELIQTSIQRILPQKRIAGIVFNSVHHDRAKKYGGEYYHEKGYERYYSE